MAFIDDIKSFSAKIISIKDTVATEEATKMSMIIPFFQLLGYDVFNPEEFCPEFVADVGIKKGEKVDYAIKMDGSPKILIECKWCGENLDKHSSQLFRYFATTSAKFCILTNGIQYRFYTDIDKPNTMDLSPFLELDLSSVRDFAVAELEKFRKENYNEGNIAATASNLKYSTAIKNKLRQELSDPSDEFIKFLLSSVYDGQKTQKIIERFQPIIKKSASSLVGDLVSEKLTSLSSALEADSTKSDAESDSAPDKQNDEEQKIVTTDSELQSYYTIKGMLVGHIPDVNDITFRDAESYFSILFRNNNRKPVCRLNFDAKTPQLFIPDEDKAFERIYIKNLNDLYTYKERFIAVITRYIKP